ncbi:MAG: hypothetical protein V4719_10950 [Planctomycetota bacterium]
MYRINLFWLSTALLKTGLIASMSRVAIFSTGLAGVLVIASVACCSTLSQDDGPSGVTIDNPNVVRFHILPRAEIVTSATGEKLAAIDDRPAKVFVIRASETAQSERDTFDRAMAHSELARQQKTKMKVVPSHEDLVIVGRLSGDGTGPQHHFSPQSIRVKECVSCNNKIVILASCDFKGPFKGGLPASKAYYLTARLPPLKKGRYSIIVRVTPEGPVYEEFRESKETKTPDFGLLTCDFEVAEQ